MVISGVQIKYPFDIGLRKRGMQVGNHPHTITSFTVEGTSDSDSIEPGNICLRSSTSGNEETHAVKCGSSTTATQAGKVLGFALRRLLKEGQTNDDPKIQWKPKTDFSVLRAGWIVLEVHTDVKAGDSLMFEITTGKIKKHVAATASHLQMKQVEVQTDTDGATATAPALCEVWVKGTETEAA